MKRKYNKRGIIAIFILLAIILLIIFSIHRCAKGTKISKDKIVSHFPEKIDYNYEFKGKLAEVFNDSNCYHVASGIVLGVSPLEDESDTISINKMDTVDSCRFYTIAKLTHSIPYLVPIAKELLDSIGSDFNKCLASRGMKPYGMVVTSLTRTDKLQKKLSRRNKNASVNSAHCFGTTFDISWVKFTKPEGEDYIPEAKLKVVLASILQQYREMKRCFVKFEQKQTCFHITVASKDIDYSQFSCDTTTNNLLLEKVNNMRKFRRKERE